MKIKKDMIIGDVVMKYPETAEIMFKYGMHCVGCHMGAYETIEDGCKAHGMSDEDIDKMVKEMNKELAKPDEGSLKVSKEALAELRKQKKAIRVKDNGKDIQFVEKAEEDDVVLESGDIKVCIEKKGVAKLKGKRLTFKDGNFIVE